MLEATVGDCADQLWLQQEVAEACGVDADIGALLLNGVSSCGGGVGLLAVGGRGLVLGLDLLVGVIDQVLFSRHDGCVEWKRS